MAEAVDNPFLAAIRRHFSDVLDEERFTLVRVSYNPDSFGNAVATYHSARLAIRFMSDKGIVFMEMGAKRTLFHLSQLTAFLAPSSNPLLAKGLDLDFPGSTEGQLALFRRLFDGYRTQLLDPSLYTKRKHELKRFLATGRTFPSGQRS